MSDGQDSAKPNAQIYEEAGEWLVRHRTGSLDTRDKNTFDAWLRTSPEHIRAYLEISAIWEDAAALGPASSLPTAAELIAKAVADDRIVSLATTASDWKKHGASAVRHRHWNGLLVMIAAVCACACGVLWLNRAPTYSTGIGEQRSIALADDSTVELNGRSEIRVRFQEHQRNIELVRGQALFHVAKDATRPFVVHAGTTLVQAIGTQFDVNESHAGTIVTVVQGRVAVFGPKVNWHGAIDHAPSGGNAASFQGEDSSDLLRSLPGNVRPVFLDAGEQVTVTAKRPDEVAHINVANVTAWTQRRLMFDSAPLAEVVDEFNRYNAKQLLITDPRLDDLRINGVFTSTDPSLLVRFLRAQPEVVVSDTSSQIRISAR